MREQAHMCVSEESEEESGGAEGGMCLACWGGESHQGWKKASKVESGDLIRERWLGNGGGCEVRKSRGDVVWAWELNLLRTQYHTQSLSHSDVTFGYTHHLTGTQNCTASHIQLFSHANSLSYVPSFRLTDTLAQAAPPATAGLAGSV